MTKEGVEPFKRKYANTQTTATAELSNPKAFMSASLISANLKLD
jgi:hypothetical protein